MCKYKYEKTFFVETFPVNRTRVFMSDALFCELEKIKRIFSSSSYWLVNSDDSQVNLVEEEFVELAKPTLTKFNLQVFQDN